MDRSRTRDAIRADKADEPSQTFWAEFYKTNRDPEREFTRGFHRNLVRVGQLRRAGCDTQCLREWLTYARGYRLRVYA